MGNGIIYALRHPENRQIFYIGSTIERLEDRLSGHLAASKAMTKPVHKVIAKLVADGLKPEAEILQEIDEDDPAAFKKSMLRAEQEWIIELSETCDIANIVHNLKKWPKESKSTPEIEEIKKLLNGCEKPLYVIEKELGMPNTTLQKAVKGDRELPIKWKQKLREHFWRPSEENFMKLPLDLSRPTADYFNLIRQLNDRESLLVLKHEIENSRVLGPEQKKSQLSTLSFKLQRTKH